MKRDSSNEEYSEEETKRRRDETVKRMIAMPPKTLKGAPKRADGTGKKKRSKPK
jgi:hypothetical protein